MGRETEVRIKRQVGLPAMIGAMASGIAVVIAAMTPIYLGVREQAKENEEKAIQSHARAEKSEEMSEMAYEILKLKIEFLHEQISDLKEDNRRTRDLLDRAPAPRETGSRRGRRGIARASRVAPRIAVGESDPLTGLESEGLEGASEPSEEGADESVSSRRGRSKRQLDLPDNLETIWEQRKAKEKR